MTAPAGFNEVDRISRLVLKCPSDAFVSQDDIARQWRNLNFTSPPVLSTAVEEYDAFVALLVRAGTEVSWLPRSEAVGLDALYVRDASIVTPRGMVLCHMGKPARRDEPAAQAASFTAWDIPVAGRIEPPGSI